MCLLLALAVALVFGRTVTHDFINFDDGLYVTENPEVQRGLTARGLAWAFSQRHADNWHPLTWLSHMLDCELYGLRPPGHHLSSVLLHAAAAIMLFLALRLLTARLWPSAFAAALFAIHPLRVESVAWVAERKDVLSGFFMMLTLWAYARYVRRPFSLPRYCSVAVPFALGLMAKPTLVTLPFVLLLLDWWPLGRIDPTGGAPRSAPGGRRGRALLLSRVVLLEKVPLLALSAASCAVTLWAQRTALMPEEELPLGWRLGNATVAWTAYLAKFLYPAELAIPYPHPLAALPAWKIAAAAAALLAITAAALAWRRTQPHLSAGWLWYLGMLVPMIGLVQVGPQAMADRYSYLPHVGLGLAVGWAGALACRTPALRRAGCAAGLGGLAVLAGLAVRQAAFWRDSEALFTRSLSVTSENYIAHANLGLALHRRGLVDEGIEQYRKALAIRPFFPVAHFNLGNALASRSRIEEAVEHYRKALMVKPNYPRAHNNLANALAGLGRHEEAIRHYREALAGDPGLAEAHHNLGVVLAARGQLDDAVAQYRAALAIRPDYARAHENLGGALEALGRRVEAAAHRRRSLELAPQQDSAAAARQPR